MTSYPTANITDEEERAQMLRVNHAGEYGARRIYAGQLSVREDETIREMAEQEDKHFEQFDAMLRERRVRPTLLMPLWHAAGFALGAITAKLGREAAMACTVAVESVIDEHYAAQEKRLEKSDDILLKSKVSQFRAEELEHHATGLAQGAESAALSGAYWRSESRKQAGYLAFHAPLKMP